MSRLVIAAALALASALPSLPAHAADPRMVLAYYYNFYDPEAFTGNPFRPEAPYQSDDVATMTRHIQQAQQAGIDAFVVLWMGNENRTDVNLTRLLDLAQRSNFKATIHFDTPNFWGVEDTVAQLQAFYANRINHPAMLRYQGRPVIFFWRVSTYDTSTWNAIRAQVDPERRALWIADGDQMAVVGAEPWDGISPYAIAWSANPAGQLTRWGSAVQSTAPEKLYIPPVSPGCDDAAVRAATCTQDRADGRYYQSTWDGALAANPSWAVIVSTFNEWLESTQIEPAEQYGDKYLTLTRHNADAFHAGGG
jgi:hypothetical protein